VCSCGGGDRHGVLPRQVWWPSDGGGCAPATLATVCTPLHVVCTSAAERFPALARRDPVMGAEGAAER
jgi:hypothetical protein